MGRAHQNLEGKADKLAVLCRAVKLLCLESDCAQALCSTLCSFINLDVKKPCSHARKEHNMSPLMVNHIHKTATKTSSWPHELKHTRTTAKTGATLSQQIYKIPEPVHRKRCYITPRPHFPHHCLLINHVLFPRNLGRHVKTHYVICFCYSQTMKKHQVFKLKIKHSLHYHFIVEILPISIVLSTHNSLLIVSSSFPAGVHSDRLNHWFTHTWIRHTCRLDRSMCDQDVCVYVNAPCDRGVTIEEEKLL